jgi:hypothetical protein
VKIAILNADNEIIHVPVLNQHLERDLRVLFTAAPWWRPFRRVSERRMVRLIDKVAADLRAASRY